MITNIVLLICEIIKELLVLCGCLNYKLKKRFMAAWSVFGISVICLAIIGVVGPKFSDISTLFFVAAIIASLMLEGEKKGILSFAVLIGISCVDSIIFIIVESVFSVSKELLYGNPVVYGGVNSISLFLIMIVAAILQKFYYGRGRNGNQKLHSSNRVYLWLFAIGLSASSISMMPLSYEGFRWGKGNIVFVITAVVVFAVSFLVMGILLVYNNSARQHYKEVARVNQSLVESQGRYYQMLLGKEEETRRFRHDMSSHLICVKRLLEESKVQEAEEYLGKLGGTLHDLSVKNQTGNTLVNAIVNDVSGRYTGVVLDWKGHLPKQMQISDVDVCVIFSNLLENAFLAASACENVGTVEVTVKSVSGALAITVENDMAKPIEEREGKLITQKADKKNHGYGTQNVRDCVEKNDGTVEFKYTEDKFTVDVVLVNVA